MGKKVLKSAQPDKLDTNVKKHFTYIAKQESVGEGNPRSVAAEGRSWFLASGFFMWLHVGSGRGEAF